MLSTQRLRILPKFVCVAKHHILGLGALDYLENSAILRRMQTVCKTFSQITPLYPIYEHEAAQKPISESNIGAPPKRLCKGV